eukprot:190605-Rhodomonas_salina.1
MRRLLTSAQVRAVGAVLAHPHPHAHFNVSRCVVSCCVALCRVVSCCVALCRCVYRKSAPLPLNACRRPFRASHMPCAALRVSYATCCAELCGF